MWKFIVTGTSAVLVGLYTYYYYFNRYNDEVIELFTIVHDDLKCIKYQYRGKKYIYLTNEMEHDITYIQQEINPDEPNKDKKPVTDYKNITLILNKENENPCEININDDKFIYSFIGPSNTYYFAFDTLFNDKLTKFMNYLFLTEEGSLTYGRLSALLPPEKYFDIKTKITEINKNNDYHLEWKIN
jgi:hypothetical protein